MKRIVRYLMLACLVVTGVGTAVQPASADEICAVLRGWGGPFEPLNGEYCVPAP